MAKPSCVITGDVHFTVPTLDLATSVVKQCLAKSLELRVPLVLNGDLLDSKAIIRGEVANRLIDLLKRQDPTRIIVNTGNHDLLSEKSKESSLNFLRPYCTVIDTPVFIDSLKSWIVPYQSDAEELKSILSKIPSGSRVIMHQGVQSAYLGHYVQDRTSLPKEYYADYRVVASHYHRAQDIKCGRPRRGAVGLFSYCGSPYSLSFGEANDGPKGFQILHEDGLLTQVPTNLRKHVVLDTNVENLDQLDTFEVNSGDLVWLKIRGPESSLKALDKAVIGKALFGHTNFRLDLCPDSAEDKVEAVDKTEGEVLDELIDKLPETPEQKTGLKALWRKVME